MFVYKLVNIYLVRAKRSYGRSLKATSGLFHMMGRGLLFQVLEQRQASVMYLDSCIMKI